MNLLIQNTHFQSINLKFIVDTNKIFINNTVLFFTVQTLFNNLFNTILEYYKKKKPYTQYFMKFNAVLLVTRSINEYHIYLNKF